MRSKLPILAFACLLVLAQLSKASTKTWTLDETLRVTLPESYQPGVPFDAQIELLQAPDTPQSLELRFNFLKAKGGYGGTFKGAPKASEKVDSPSNFNFEFSLDENDQVGVALLTIYLSPDRSWAKRSFSAAFPILPQNGDRDAYLKAVARAETQSIAPKKNFPPYEPRTSYFEQRVDEPGRRTWKTDPQHLPPLETILARPPREHPVYGIYSWAEEFMRGPEEVSKVGIRSLRLSGPWDIAGPALDYAAQNDIQVLYTILGGGDKNGFWKNRRQNMESDEALIEAFKENVESFVRKFGPGGSYFADKPYDSPVVLVEMWNEPNFHYLIPNSGDRKKDEPQREALYARLLQAGYDTVKSVNPDLDVGGFATGGSGAGDMRFIEHVLRQNPGIEQKFDVLTTHPYVMGAAPESQKYQPWGSYSVANNLKTIRASMEASGIGDMPIWYTEFGWQISQEHGGLMADPPKRLDLMVTPDLQAAYTVRGYLWTMRLGVERLFIMHMYDSDGFNGGFFERGTMEWRPLAHAVQNLIRLMPDPKLIGAQSDGQDNTYIYEFTADHFDPDSDKVIAVWNVVGPTEVVVDVGTTEPEVTLYDLVGNTMQTTVHEGTITIEAGPYPILIPIQ